MRVTTLWQPFAADGSYASLGVSALAEIGSGAYRRLRVCVAYVTSSGTSRVFGATRAFIAGGGEAHFFIGLRNGTTSVQAVQHLLSTGATVFGCDTKRSVLFHPKVYLLDGPRTAWLAVGSSNLTREGLFRNYEASTITTLELAHRADAEYLRAYHQWFASLPSAIEDCSTIGPGDLDPMFDDGRLVDEASRPEIENIAAPRKRGHRAAVIIPPAPPPHPEAPVVARRARRRPVAAPASAVVGTPRHFAMWLSAFDASHRRDTPGTPEISLPEAVAGFFPPVALAGRQYPDCYFDVLMNDPSGKSRMVNYRIWQRPPGATVGHADWRINVKHDTIDLTSPVGGDLILFERLPEGSQPPYEVWVVHPTDPTYNALLARCNQQVGAAGAAGVKRWGLF